LVLASPQAVSSCAWVRPFTWVRSVPRKDVILVRAPVMSAPSSLALARLAASNMVPRKLAPRKLANDMHIKVALAPSKFAPCRSLALTQVLIRSAPASWQLGQSTMPPSIRATARGSAFKAGSAWTRAGRAKNRLSRGRKRFISVSIRNICPDRRKPRAIGHRGTARAGPHYLCRAVCDLDKRARLYAMAARFRHAAGETAWPGYRARLLQTAEDLENEADRLQRQGFGAPVSRDTSRTG